MSVDLEQMLAEAVKKVIGEQQSQLPEGETVKKADVEAQFAAFKTEIEALVKDVVAKAMPLDRNGVGRQGTVETNEPTLESDPVAALSRKATALRTGKEQDYTVEEKQVAAALFIAYVEQGMKE